MGWGRVGWDCGVVWYDVVWWGVVCCGVVCYGVVWCGVGLSPFVYCISFRSLLQAHRMLCNGVSFHTLGPVLSFLRFEPTFPLFGLALWSIITSFSGCDTFLAAVRSLSPPQAYVLLSACDIDSNCRRAISILFTLLSLSLLSCMFPLIPRGLALLL
jgi:hypothetical protein